MQYKAALPSLAIALSSLFQFRDRNSPACCEWRTATLSVFGPRPVDLAAKKLVNEFRVVINVEDPMYLYGTMFRTYAAGVRVQGDGFHTKSLIARNASRPTPGRFSSGCSTSMCRFGQDGERAVALCLSHRPRW